MRVAFRVDASIQIGTGHVMRCLALADELSRQGHECWFVCREQKGHLGGLVVSKGHGLTLLSPPDTEMSVEQASDEYVRWLGVPSALDADETRNAISSLNPDWMVVDHYGLDAEWENAVAPKVGNIMVIDDLANRGHECAILLDQNLGRLATDYDGLVPISCQQLIGPRYALLRPEFAQLREQSLQRRKEPELKRILISLGGVDRTNVTGQILEAMTESSLPVTTELDIIMGATAPYLKEVRAQVAGLPFKSTVSVGVKNMAERMCRADLAIGAVGSTSWERCCLGLPSILMVLAENQISAANALKKSGAVILAESSAEVRDALEKLSTSSKSSLIRMAKLNSDMVLGNGCQKVVRELSERGRR